MQFTARPPHRFLVSSAILALVLTAAAPLSAKVLAKVDGVEITDDDVQVALDDLGPSLPQQIEGPQREAYVLDYLIDLRLVAKKASAEKMGDGPDVARRLAYYRDKVMMESLLGKAAREGATDAALKQVYDEAAAKQKPEEEISARHILVPTEEEAKAALKRVRAGEDFAKVADEVSKDPGSKGGDLGWFTKDRMVPEFGEAAYKLNKGEISEPVKSQFGWHVIKLDDKRQKAFPAFEDVKSQVAQYVAQKSQTELILKLREAAKIERTEAPAAQVPAPAAPAAPK
jgi:peptidyl-prolyl cis-trans isomerase C